MSETNTVDNKTGECAVTSDDLKLSPGHLKHSGAASWSCSRPVWADGRCVWHTDATEKPPNDLAAEIGDGDLHGARLSETDLRSFSFPDDTGLVDADLSEADLSGTDLSEANFYCADLSHGALKMADLSEANLYCANLSEVTLQHADVSEAHLYGADLSEAYLIGTDFSGADLAHADLSEADLPDTILSKADLENADLSQADLRYADFSKADLKKADLSQADLEKADLSRADLRYADLSQADLRYADFSKADLKNADLSQADLRYADFSKADLENADLSQADIRESLMNGINMYQADMTRVDARGATFDTSTIPVPLGKPRGSADPIADDTLPPQYGISRDAVERGLITAHDVTQYHSYPNLEDAICENGDFRGTVFMNARLYQTDLTNARINAETNAEAGAWVHRRLERLLKNNALSERSREFHVRKQEAERTHHRWSAEWPPTNRDALGHWGRWTVLTLSGGLTRHGESLKRVVGWSLGVIITAAVLFPWVGGFHSRSRGRTFRLVLGGPVDIGEIVTTYGQSLYFSVITFSTIGYGDLSPRGVGSQVLVGVESLLGALLVALFIFVLGRRTER